MVCIIMPIYRRREQFQLYITATYKINYGKPNETQLSRY